MAPAKIMTFTGGFLIAAAGLVAALLLSSHIDAIANLVLRLDIMAAIIGVILAVTGLVFSDMRKLFWENARATVRKTMRDDKHAA